MAQASYLDDYEGLLQQLKQAGDGLASQQRAVGDQYRGQAKPLMEGNLQYNLAPLAALVDSWTGSKLQAGYQTPETGEQRQQKINGLQDQAAGAGLKASGTEMDTLRELAQGTMGLEKLRADADYRAQDLEIKRRRANAMTPGMGKPTVAETAVDKAFAKRYEDDVVGGNLAVAQKETSGLKALRDRITRGELGEVSGPKVGATPEVVRSFFFPEAVAAQQQIQKAVQASLKATLGAQFTEREGDAILKRTFDPRLSPEENARRLNALIDGIEAADAAKRASYDYYEKNGTLRGFKGYDSIENDFLLSVGDSPKEPLEDEDSAALRWAKDNPTDPRSQAILKANGAQ